MTWLLFSACLVFLALWLRASADVDFWREHCRKSEAHAGKLARSIAAHEREHSHRVDIR